MRVSEIIERFGGVCEGDSSVEVKGITGIEFVKSGYATFALDDASLRQAEESQAACVIVPHDMRKSGTTLVRCESPQRYTVELMNAFHPQPAQATGVHPSAVVDESSQVDGSASIGPYVTIGADCRIGPGTVLMALVAVADGCEIGAETVIHPNVTVYPRVHIGSRVIIHAGATIGADGFGYFSEQNVLHKWPHVGNVVIEDDVEIGANACIDRAKFGTTLIERGAKIDNLVQVGHNCRVGQFAILAGQTGLAGSVVVETGAICGGQVGVADHKRIGRGARLGAQSGILSDVPPGTDMFGHPAQPLQPALQEIAFMRYLNENRKVLRKMIRNEIKSKG